jgi:hypothetical protein
LSFRLERIRFGRAAAAARSAGSRTLIVATVQPTAKIGIGA